MYLSRKIITTEDTLSIIDVKQPLEQTKGLIDNGMMEEEDNVNTNSCESLNTFNEKLDNTMKDVYEKYIALLKEVL